MVTGLQTRPHYSQGHIPRVVRNPQVCGNAWAALLSLHQEPGCWVLETWPEPRTAPWRRGPFLGVSHDNNLKSAFKSTTFSWPGPMMALWHSSFLSLVKHIIRFLDRKGGPAKASMPKQGKNRWRRYWGGNISTVVHKLNFTTSSFASRTIHSLRSSPSACYETGNAGMKWRRKENGW